MVVAELQVVADEDRLSFRVLEPGARARAAANTDLGRSHTLIRGERLRERVVAACGRGGCTAADLDAIRAQSQLLHDLVIPSAVRTALRQTRGEPLLLRLSGWARELPWEWLHDGEQHWFTRYALGRVETGDAARCVSGRPRTFGVFVPPARHGLADRLERLARQQGWRGRVHRSLPTRSELRGALRAADTVHIELDVGPPGIRCRDGWFGLNDFGGLDGGPRLLVLAGESTWALGRAARRAGIPSVVVSTTPLLEGRGAAVLESFHERVLGGAPLGRALSIARASVPSPQALPWILLGHPVPAVSAVGDEVAVAFGVDDPTADRVLREIRGSAEALGLAIAQQGQHLLVMPPLERFGDRAVEAALCLGERVLARFAPTPATVGPALRVGVAVGAGASERAVSLSARSGDGAMVVDRDTMLAGRRERRSFEPLRRPAAGLDCWAARPGTRAPPRALLGRDAELQRLQVAMDAALAAGERRIVVVAGPSGIGKSALVAGFVRRAQDRGHEARVTGRSELARDEAEFGAIGVAPLRVVEDVHRGSASVFDELLAALAASAHPGLIVLTVRDGTEEARRRVRVLEEQAAIVTRLGPLDSGDASAVVRQIRRRAQLQRADQDEVGTAEGNPLLLRLVASGGAIRDASIWLVRALVAERVRGVGDDTARVLEAAAVIGRPCSTTLLESLPGVTSRAVAQAASAGWLSLRSESVAGKRRARCTLTDRLMVRWLEELIPTARRAALHQAVLEAAPEASPDRRAHHALRSQDPLQAIAPLWQAIRAAPRGPRSAPQLDALESLLATTAEQDLPPGSPTTAQVRAMVSAGGTPELASFDVRGQAGVGRLGTRYVGDGPDGEVELRVLHPALTPDAAGRLRLEERLRQLSAVGHPAIVPVTPTEDRAGQLVLWTPVLHGITVRNLLQVIGAPPVDIVTTVALDAADLMARLADRDPALMSALDLRPEGIWLEDAGRVRIEHLTVLQGISLQRLGELGALRGRVGYLAPELLEGRPHPANGLWSLGAVLWELTVGEPLFRGPSIKEMSADVRRGALADRLDRARDAAPALGYLARRLLVRDPDARPSPAEVAAELRQAEDHVAARGRAADLVSAVRGAATATASWG